MEDNIPDWFTVFSFLASLIRLVGDFCVEIGGDWKSGHCKYMCAIKELQARNRKILALSFLLSARRLRYGQQSPAAACRSACLHDKSFSAGTGSRGGRWQTSFIAQGSRTSPRAE